MAEKSLKFLLFGEDKGAGGVFGALGVHASSVSGAIAGSFGKMGQAVGGELGGMLGDVGEKFDALGEHASKGTKVLAAGGAITSIGTALRFLASSEVEATAQLQQAITDSGHSYEEYEGKIDAAVKAQENFGNSAQDTKTALQKMTEATGDPQKALDKMGLVANLAADRNISLADAATLVDKVLAGKGTKMLAEYGITMAKAVDPVKEMEKAQRAHAAATHQLISAQDKYKLLQDELHGKAHLTAADHDRLAIAADKVKTAQYLLTQATNDVTKAHKDAANAGKTQQAALDQLAGKIDGQAAASVDNFSAKIGILRTKFTDWAEEASAKVGPALTAIGPVLMGVGAAMELVTARRAASTAAAAAAVVATEAETVATGEATVAQTGLNLAFLANPITWVVIGIVALIGAVVLAYNKVGWFHDLVNTAFAGIKAVVGAVTSWFVETAWPKIKLFAEYAIGGFRLLWNTYAAIIGWIIGKGEQFVGWFMETAWPKIRLFIALSVAGFTSIWHTFSSAVGWIIGKGVALVTWFSGLPGKIADAVSGAWDGLKNGFKAALNWIIDRWNSMPSFTIGGGTFLGKTLPSMSFGLPHLPHLQSGGDITAGGMVRLGDNGPENVYLGSGASVVPLSARQGGAPSVVVNLTASPGYERQAAETLVRTLEKYFGTGGTMTVGKGLRTA